MRTADSDRPLSGLHLDRNVCLSMPYRFVGRAIGIRRVARGLTQKTLAKFAGISAAHVSELENSNYAPSVTTLANIAEALECAPADLLDACLRKV